MTEKTAAGRERPWIMRTYSGHSSASASNSLFRSNIAKGQTGLSVAFDLPTQLGYDPDHPLARGEVGKVGVPVSHLGDMRALMQGIPLETMNTSMTINATAPWLLALYVALAEERGVDPKVLQGTTQNDILKEYLSRGTYIFPPAQSLKLTSDTIVYTVRHVPAWNPMNLCSYHLQEAGATPVQEIAYTLSTAIAVLDAVKGAGGLGVADMTNVVARLSFFVNAGLRFVEEVCKLRALSLLWERLGRERYGVTDSKALRFRYGVQVNSLGLTEAQPENNVYRILLEMLAVTLSKDVRARAVQLPAWNEALGLPRPWDQQWSLRCQQVLAYETDLLEYADIFEGSRVVEDKTRAIARERLARGRRGAAPRRRGGLRAERLHQGAPGRVQRPASPAESSRVAARWSGSTATPRPSRRRSSLRSTAAQPQSSPSIPPRRRLRWRASAPGALRATSGPPERPSLPCRAEWHEART